VRQGNGFLNDTGEPFKCSVEERLVSLELLPGIDRTSRSSDSKKQKHARDHRPKAIMPLARPLGSANDLIKAKTQQPRHYFLCGKTLAVALVTRISRDGFLALIGQRAIRPKLEAQRKREALTLGVARLSVNDQRNHKTGAAEHLKTADFLVDVLALRCVRRTNDNEELRGFERGNRLLGQRESGGKIFAIAKNRPQCLWHRSPRRFATDQILVDAIPFKCGIQPLAPRFVAVAVAKKCPIFEGNHFGHILPRSSSTLSG